MNKLNFVPNYKKIYDPIYYIYYEKKKDFF